MAKQSMEVPAGWTISVGGSASGMFKYAVRLSGPTGPVTYDIADTKWGVRRIIKRFRTIAWASENMEF